MNFQLTTGAKLKVHRSFCLKFSISQLQFERQSFFDIFYSIKK